MTDRLRQVMGALLNLDFGLLVGAFGNPALHLEFLPFISVGFSHMRVPSRSYDDRHYPLAYGSVPWVREPAWRRSMKSTSMAGAPVTRNSTS